MRQDATPSVAATRLHFEGGHSKPKLPDRTYRTADTNHNEPSYNNTDYYDPALKYLSAQHDLDRTRSMQSDYKLANGDVAKGGLDSGSVTPEGSSGVGTLVKQYDQGTTPSTNISRSNLSYRQRWDQSRRGTPVNHDSMAAMPKVTSQPALDLADIYVPQMSYDSNYSVFSLPHTFDALPKVASPSHAFNSTPQLWGDRSVNRSVVSVPMNNSHELLRTPSLRTHHTPPRTASVDTQPVTPSRERIASLALLSLLSLVLAAVSLQLLFRMVSDDSSDTTYVREVCIAVTSFCVMLCFSCVMVCALQTICALRLARCEGGEQRSTQYLEDCAATRFIAVTAFFMAIPVFILALLLFALAELQMTTSIICTVVMAIGLVFTFTSAIHNVYCWRVEKMNADWVIANSNEKKTLRLRSELNHSELSTLV